MRRKAEFTRYAHNPPHPLSLSRGQREASGCPHYARAPIRSRGFTLIELVVVLLILTIILGMVGVQLTRDENDVVRDEAQRLALVLQSAQQQAILEGRPYAFALTKDGYQFLRLGDKGRLVPIEADEILAPRLLPRAIMLAPAKASDRMKQSKQRADLILFDPSGEFPAFAMVFEIGDIAWYVQGRTDGRIGFSNSLDPAAT